VFAPSTGKPRRHHGAIRLAWRDSCLFASHWKRVRAFAGPMIDALHRVVRSPTRHLSSAFGYGSVSADRAPHAAPQPSSRYVTRKTRRVSRNQPRHMNMAHAGTYQHWSFRIMYFVLRRSLFHCEHPALNCYSLLSTGCGRQRPAPWLLRSPDGRFYSGCCTCVCGQKICTFL
jgi:hypothetical protein